MSLVLYSGVHFSLTPGLLLTVSTASTEAAQRGEVTHPYTHSVAEPPPLPPSRRSAGSGVGSCGGRARLGRRIRIWGQQASGRGGRAPGEGLCFPGIGGRERWAAAPGWVGWTCTREATAPWKLGTGDSGQDPGLGIVNRLERSASQKSGGPGQRTGAGTSHRVLQQRAGGGRGPQSCRGAGRGRAGVSRVRGDRGAGGAPGTPLSVPARRPSPRPAPRRTLSRSRGQAMTRTDRAAGGAGAAPA